MDATELAFAGVARQAELVRAGEVTPRELVELYVERIERLDPQLNAFRIVYRERARAEADQAAARLKAGDERPLLGVPLAIKDNVDVAGDITTNGTSAAVEPATADCETVRRVREAGAVILGKTHTPELCMWNFTESATYGITRNPWNLDRAPGGSSGGSAAAVAAGLVGAAMASDSAGSIRIPAACCGVFGLKPQRGRISLAPWREHWHGLTVYGWLTRSVADTALLLDVTRGTVPGDPVTPPEPPAPYEEAAATPPGPLRIAWSVATPPSVVQTTEDEQARAVRETADLLASLGHQVVERDPDYGVAFLTVVTRYLRGISEEAATLDRPDRLERRTRGMVALGGLIPDSVLARARAAEAGHAERLNRIFDSADVLITPVLREPAVRVGRWEGRGPLWTLNGAATAVPFPGVWNMTGQPAASVPAGVGAHDLPLSVQLVGRPDDESTLLALAAQLESERPWAQRRPPIA